MSALQRLLHELVNDVSDTEALKVISFIECMKLKREQELYTELGQIGDNALDFGDNMRDDED